MTARASGASITPSTVCPRRSAARYANTGMALRVFLSDPKDLVDGGHSLLSLGPSVEPQRDHPVVDGLAADLPGGHAAEGETANFLGDLEELVDAGAAAVAGTPALCAPTPAVEGDPVVGLDPQELKIGRGRP